MKLGGSSLRLELLPENDEDKKVIEIILARERVIRQVLNDSHPLIYWGDSDEDGGRGGLIINSIEVNKVGVSTGTPPTVEGTEVAAE